MIHRDGMLYAVPYHWGYGYCEYNKDKVAPPTKYKDLLSAKLKKKVGLPDDPYAVIRTGPSSPACRSRTT